MKKILGLTIAALLVLGMVGGGTWAYFSDVETSTGNTFTAGTLNLQVGDEDPTIVNITEADRAPGDSYEYDWALKNDGSRDGSLDITFTITEDQDNGGTEPEITDGDTDTNDPGEGEGELDSYLDILIYIDEDGDTDYTGSDTLVYQGKVVGIGGEKLSNYTMVTGYDKSIRVEWSIDSGVGNIIQSDSTGFNIEFELLQLEGAD